MGVVDKRILVVDDQDDIRRLVCITLDYGRHRLFEATNGAEALRTMEEVSPDLVVLDLMLPGALDGYQVCESIKRNRLTRDTPILMLTACDSEKHRSRARLAGCNAYLAKPFRPLHLIEIVERLIGSD